MFNRFGHRVVRWVLVIVMAWAVVGMLLNW